MIPAVQTNVGGRGNCMAACWASILEVPIEHVPDYRAVEAAGGNWMNAVNTWLSKHCWLLYIELEPEVTRVVRPRGWHLMNYGTRDGGHAIVGFEGVPFWDPSSAGDVGLGKLAYHDKYLYSYGLLVVLHLERGEAPGSLQLRTHDFEEFIQVVDIYGLRSESERFSTDGEVSNALARSAAQLELLQPA